jgi:HK97 family phage major capsid protein
MSFYETEYLEKQIGEVKGLAVGISRGLRDLERSGVARPRKRERRPADTLVKAACCELLRKSEIKGNGRISFQETGVDAAQRLYPGNERVLEIVARAAVNPATTTTAGYASELVQTELIDFLASAEQPSAFSQLASKALTIGISGAVKVPSRVYPLTLVGGWLAEAAPKPVYQVPLTSVSLSPSKLVAMCAWSEELARASLPDIERVVADSLQHDLSGLLDTALLDASAATSVRPAGLFAGATSVTPTAPAGVVTPAEAMLTDLQNLYEAVATGAPDANVVLIANPSQAIRLRLAGVENVIASGYMTAGNVGAVDAGGVVVMGGGIRFLASTDATVHMDSAPTAIGTAGSPNTIAAPTVSLWQADMIALRSVLMTSWKLRRSGATALASSVNW